MAAPVLAYEDLGVVQGAGWLFRHLDLYIGARDRLALIGRNGAGKSTLGQLIAGLLRPTRGARAPVAATADGLGQYLFQNPEHQFVSESVADELAASGVAESTAEAALRELGLWDKRDSHPFQLSQGQKRRLSFQIGRAHV